MKWVLAAVGLTVGAGIGFAIGYISISVAISEWPHVNPPGWEEGKLS